MVVAAHPAWMMIRDRSGTPEARFTIHRYSPHTIYYLPFTIYRFERRQ
jgi:hypothetical protein